MTSLLTMAIHPARKAQIALLVTKEVKISTKYSDFSDVFLKKKTLILLEVTELNQYAIELQEGQQLLYRPIYSLGLVELETLKLTSKFTLLTTSFGLQSYQLVLLSSLSENQMAASAYTWIIGVNNLTIKNQYPLLHW